METTFSDQQYDLYYPPGIERHWWNLARNRLLAGILEKDVKKPGVMLEVGCGRGVVVKDLDERGFEIRGVELAEVQPMKEAQSLVDAGTDVFDLPEEQRSMVSSLLLLDVLEHLPEDTEFLRNLANSFPNLSHVVVTVPARQELWSNYDAQVGHYRRYTLESLENMATELGWTLRKTGYFFRFSYLAMRLMSILGIKRSTQFEPPGKAARMFHGAVSVACGLEQRVLPGRVPGSSAFAVFSPIT